MGNLIEKVSQRKISRRTFLKASAAGTATLALSGCSTSLTTVGTATDVGEKEGKWVSATCWHNCGGRCVNKAYVIDGIIVRQKTDDTRPDTPDVPQQRGCLRGRSQKFQAQGADRLKYPMIRKNWETGGGKKELRGKDEWVRISWDEALDILASETKRIKETYGNASILAPAPSIEIQNLLTAYGGFVPSWGTVSFGSWYLTPALIGFSDNCIDVKALNDRFDMRKTELVVAFGMNPAWSSMGNPTYHFLQMKKAGVKFIFIDPIYHDSISVLDGEWIPIRPATDMALLLAMSYTLITEDDPVNNPLIDWDFLHRCTVGFDADHMPKDAETDENFKDYVLGKYDNTPKTPEWASEICGIDPNTIRYLARAIGMQNKVSILAGWASGRAQNSDNLPQMFMAIGAMTGHIGKSGHMTGVCCWNYAANSGPPLVNSGGNGEPYLVSPLKEALCEAEMWTAILDKKYKPNKIINSIFGYPAGWKDTVKGLDLKTLVPEEDINIQMIWHTAEASLQTRDGMNKGIEAHRTVEFVVSQSHFLTTNSKYADLVLPVTTLWERAGDIAWGTNRDALIVSCQVIEPMYEAKDDQWIAEEVAKRLDIDPSEIVNSDRKQQFFNKLAGSTVVTEDGQSFEPLVEIKEADISEWGVQGQPQKGRIPLKKLLEDGVYQVERYKGDNYGFIAYEDFRKDPEKYLANTVSGKMEIYCQTLADIVNNFGYTKIAPYPKYIPPVQGYEATFKDWENRVEGDYPYQLITPHYLRRSHSIFDNIPQLKESCPNPVFLAAKDAEEKGVKDGDTVLVSSEFGQILRNACVTERLVPGVVALPHGAWCDIDEKTGIDHGGADNILSGNIPTGQGISGWNTCNVNFEKWTGTPLIPDHEKPQRIIF
ncbi:MAG: molybdopterin-dependent oxidoreductase [Desulfitobacterium sp.]|nr:molybdopterin-dependent oxidoreductase [Desulfitobacterium sp.]